MTLAQFQVATNRTETNASLACFAICTPPCFAYTTSELRVSTNHFVCFVSFQPNHWYLHLQDKTWPPTLHAYCRRSDWSWSFGSRICSIEINNQFMWSNLFKFNTCKALFYRKSCFNLLSRMFYITSGKGGWDGWLSTGYATLSWMTPNMDKMHQQGTFWLCFPFSAFFVNELCWECWRVMLPHLMNIKVD